MRPTVPAAAGSSGRSPTCTSTPGIGGPTISGRTSSSRATFTQTGPVSVDEYACRNGTPKRSLKRLNTVGETGLEIRQIRGIAGVLVNPHRPRTSARWGIAHQRWNSGRASTVSARRWSTGFSSAIGPPVTIADVSIVRPCPWASETPMTMPAPGGSPR
jgi:hypothetical protein